MNPFRMFEEAEREIRSMLGEDFGPGFGFGRADDGFERDFFGGPRGGFGKFSSLGGFPSSHFESRFGRYDTPQFGEDFSSSSSNFNPPSRHRFSQ